MLIKYMLRGRQVVGKQAARRGYYWLHLTDEETQLSEGEALGQMARLESIRARAQGWTCL